MSQPYVKPSIAGVTMSFGGGTQQAIYDGVLSYQKDAQAFVNAIAAKYGGGAKLVNAATTPSFGAVFVGLTPDAQPWVIQFSGGQFQFCGINIEQRAEASGGLIDGPGDYIQQHDGSFKWVPAPPVTTIPSPVQPNPADAAAWAAIQGAGSLTEAQKDALLINIAIAVGAKVPQ